MNRNSLKQHMVEGPVLPYDFTLHSRVRDHTNLHELIWRCVGTAFGHFPLGSHNTMVTALGPKLLLHLPYTKSRARCTVRR